MSDDKPTPTKSRPAPGERRIQILQTLAQMLETPGGERVTTALLAKRLHSCIENSPNPSWKLPVLPRLIPMRIGSKDELVMGYLKAANSPM